MTTSTDLLNPRSQSALFQVLLGKLAAKSLNSKGWAATQLARALTEVDADTLALYEANRKDIFDGAYITSAVGAYLDLAATWYGEVRHPPQTAIIRLHFVDDTGEGPYSLPPGQIVAYSPDADTAPIYFRSTQTIDIPHNGSADAFFAATAPGAAYNIHPFSITDLQTPVPGVAVSSPAIPGTGSILVIPGADAEGDEPLRVRCLLKLATAGTGWAADTIRSLILDNFPAVTRVLVLDPAQPGVCFAVLADEDGPVDISVAVAVYDFLRDKKRKPVSNIPVKVYPAQLGSKHIAVQLYVAGSAGNANTNAAARLLAYQRTLDIGTGSTIIYESRIKAEVIDLAADGSPGPDGILGAHVLGGDAQPLQDFTPDWASAIVFDAVFLPPIVV